MTIFRNGDIFRLALSLTYSPDYKAGAWIDPEPSVSLTNLQTTIRKRLGEAETIREINERMEEGLSAFRDVFMKGIDELEEEVKENTETRNLSGLVGEIITEIATEQCLSITPLDINWRRGGHANRGGMDIIGVWNRSGSDLLVLIDSKFCGKASIGPDAYARKRIEEAMDGIENYQENELKMARSFVAIANKMLKTPQSLHAATTLLNLFEMRPKVNAPSIILSQATDVESIIKNPPLRVESVESHVALTIIDLRSCDFLQELIPTLGTTG